jgi:hypothetical protein
VTIRLSIVIPSNRDRLDAIARILKACAWSGPQIEVIARDNSGSAVKRQMLAQIERENCQIIAAEPCDARENVARLIQLAKGDFVFIMADDDDYFDQAIAALPRMIEGIVGDQAVSGITGAYVIESSQGSSVVGYQNLESDDTLVRISGYLRENGPNLLFYSPIRRQVLMRTFDLINAMPFVFSFRDQIISLLYLLNGKFIQQKRLMYLYETGKWGSPETAQQIDLSFYKSSKLDPAINKLHWFICGFEGAALIRNSDAIPPYTLAQRQAMADYWFATMFQRFKGHTRLNFQSSLAAEADALCRKLKSAVVQMSFLDMLKDICNFMELSSPENAQKYLDYWAKVLTTRLVSAA